AEVDRDVGPGELGQLLAAAAAGRDQRRIRQHGDLVDPRGTAGHKRPDRARLRTQPLRIRGVLDVRTRVYAPVVAPQCRADAESRIRRMRALPHGARRIHKIGRHPGGTWYRFRYVVPRGGTWYLGTTIKL